MHDGRDICRDCLMQGITHFSELKPIFKNAKDFVNHLTGLGISHHCKVSLINAETLSVLIQKEFRPTRNFDPREAGFCRTILTGNQLKSEIFIESFHSRTETMLTCVHEYGHALFFEKQKNRNYSHEENEGFSRWLEYQYLVSIGENQKAKSLIENRTVYGKGLQIMLNLGQKDDIIYYLFTA